MRLLERRCRKMYTILVTKIGGLEGVTNYFHYVGSGHVVSMCRMWGNLWKLLIKSSRSVTTSIAETVGVENGHVTACRSRFALSFGHLVSG